MDERFVPEPVNCLAIDVDEKAAAISAAELARALETGDPGIAASTAAGSLSSWTC
jgi:hypothetical protein